MAQSVPILGIIIPCYNEDEVIGKTSERLFSVIKRLIGQKKISEKSFIVFIDDGSKDKTWTLIEQLQLSSPDSIRGIKLSTNCGHQNALLAGMLSSYKEADCLVSIDADLQDDESAIELMIDKFLEGHEIVYGVRRERKKDTYFKKITAELFYKLMRRLGADIIYNHADFRLMSRKVLAELEKYQEANLFLRGIFPVIGFKSTQVFYDRTERLAGHSKYPFKKMVAFALDGITSFSIKPLRMIAVSGFIIFLTSILLSAYAVYSYLMLGTVKGWASTVLPIYFLGGVQLLAIGILGEYLGKIYIEVKRRPRFIIEKKI